MSEIKRPQDPIAHLPSDTAADGPALSSRQQVQCQDLETAKDSRARQTSALARELIALKSKAFELSEARARIPQPLFWSLFNSKLKDIKQRKALERNVKELLTRMS
jgi:hypothetical protein